jgi:hypothetical protein
VLHPRGVVELCDGAVGDLQPPDAGDAAVRLAALRLYAGWMAPTPAAGVAAALGATQARRAA